jgi:hypothetical protein
MGFYTVIKLGYGHGITLARTPSCVHARAITLAGTQLLDLWASMARLASEGRAKKPQYRVCVLCCAVCAVPIISLWQ